jgi:hypothetical protein
LTEKTIRLTISNKRIISGKILTYRFKKDADNLVRRYRALANDVYNDIYPESMRKKMAELPNGWLPEVSHFSASFGGEYGSLYFDGPSLGNNYSYGVKFNERDDDETKRLMLSKDRSGAVKVYDANHRFCDEYRELRNLSKDFEARMREGFAKIQQAFKLSSTVQGLKAKWPEVAPFLGDLDPPPVPALPTAELNSYFELPVID